MATLRIEHEINDYSGWKAALDRFADARTPAADEHPTPTRQHADR